MSRLAKILGAGASAVCFFASAAVQAEPSWSAPIAGERVVDLLLQDGERQRVLYDAPAHARGAIVMLPGGSGDVGLQRDSEVRRDDNFVVRTRADWVARGYAVLIPDTIDRANLRGVRSSPAYAQLVERLATYAGDQAHAPVFLMGTSQGSIAAMNGAAHAQSGLVAGLILTESVSVMGHSGETVFDADPGNVRVPALVVANRDDACDVAPPSMARRIAAAMTRAPSARVLFVSGGSNPSAKACSSLSPHGYYGIEAPVIAQISAWIAAHGG